MFNQGMENVSSFLMGIRMAHQPKIMSIVEGWWRLLFRQMYVWTLKASSAQHLRKPFYLIPRNKQSFIDLLEDALKSNGHTVRQIVNEANVDTASSVLGIACEGKNVTLVGAHKDLLILLLYMWNDSMGSMTMKCEGTKKYSKITRNIGELAKCLTQIKYLTYIHAFRGCDTTSATYELGKISIMKAI